jgi:diguanylate cyclase
MPESPLTATGGIRGVTAGVHRPSRGLHDPLTGLPNRSLFEDRLDRGLLVAARDTQSLALLTMAIDDFDEVNERLGDACSDALLKAVAGRLGRLLRSEDTVARLGRDRFAILPSGNTDLDGAAAVAWKVLRALDPAFVIRGHTIDATVRLGISLFPHHSADSRTLLSQADSARQDAKRSGSGFAVFAAVPTGAQEGRLALMGELRHCVAREELVLHYQPRIDLASGRTLGVEALVRWNHPRDGLLEPTVFIPLVERSGFIAPLTRWVLNEALHQLRSWRDCELDLTMAVNLSARSLEGGDIVETVAELTETWDVPSDHLTLEITEGTLINAAAPSVLERLHRMGQRLSIDDYGTGYSSLAYLRQLPVDEVKIDKSFVIDLASATDTAKIVQSTIDLGHDLGLKVCAEGVEGYEAQEMLREYGCDSAQGYFISRPLSAENMVTWLADPARRPPST